MPNVRIPKTPPSLGEFYRSETFAERIRDFFTPEVAAAVQEMNDRYLPWDHLRYHKPPANLSTTEFWYAIQIWRKSGRQTLPLSFTQKDRLVHYVTPPKHLEMIHEIDKKGAGTITSSRETIFDDESQQYLFNSLMEEAIASSQLEGASTTRPIAKEMLRTNRKPQTEAEQMILNNYRAMLAVRDSKDEQLTPEFLWRVQATLVEHTSNHPDEAGRFRRQDEPVAVVEHSTNEVIHFPPAAGELDWRIAEICDFANADSKPFVHPVMKAAILHFMLGYVHPFVDGNGRTARAIFYWYMLKKDYWLFEYFPISRVLVRAPARYARAYLYSETDGGDLTYFIRYNLDSIVAAIDDFHEYIADEGRAQDRARDLLEEFPGLNHRQRGFVHDTLKNPGLFYSISEYRGKYRVTYPTAHKDLKHLHELGLLMKWKTGNVLFFGPPKDLKVRLQPPRKSGRWRKEKPSPQPIAVTRMRSPAKEADKTGEPDDEQFK